jgi:hypothetical protein
MTKEYVVKRRVHQQAGSYLVVLPKLWADANGITNGSEVEIRFNGIVKVLAPADQADPE